MYFGKKIPVIIYAFLKRLNNSTNSAVEMKQLTPSREDSTKTAPIGIISNINSPNHTTGQGTGVPNRDACATPSGEEDFVQLESPQSVYTKLSATGHQLWSGVNNIAAKIPWFRKFTTQQEAGVRRSIHQIPKPNQGTANAPQSLPSTQQGQEEEQRNNL
jgi:hypothetical protein